MSEAEAAPYEPAVAEEPFDLLGQGIGRDIEILRPEVEQQVAHAPADEETLKSRILQAIEHAQGVR